MENPMVNYSRIIADTASNHFNVRDEYKTNTYEQNVAITVSEQRRFSVGCINITGELNIGMMIRSACLLGAENFYIFGRKKFDKRSTVGAEKYINIVYV
jgi:tRNA G18 (ribose-2'-O)-methylase SpoU